MSGYANAFADRLIDPEFVSATGGGEIIWKITTKVACPPVDAPMRLHWSRMRDELMSSPWDLLLCSAGSLSAILCNKAAEVGRKAMDVGALDQRIQGCGLE